MNEIEILVVGPQLPALMETLEATFRVHKLWLAEDREAFLAGIAPRVRGMVTSFVHGADASLISALEHLEIIANYGVGLDKTDVQFAQQRGIMITNTPDISEPVADTAMALLLAITRRVCEADRYMRAGKWGEEAFPFGTHLGGKTCGIVGLGRIGRAIAKRAEAFGMEIAYFGPRAKSDAPYRYYASLTDLAAASDVLMLALPGGPETRHIVDAKILRALGPKGFLVNVARGSVVDERALIDALQSGQMAGAALDVFEVEPLAASPLFAMDNVVLLPHIASATTETRHAMGDVVLANLKAHFENRPVLTPVLA